MGSIKILEVISFSSEDPKHPAENLLKPDSYKKWKCAADNAEKQAYVILKLESLTTINSIDIGNESSAFVEVLAAREGLDYKVILPASSFMSPLEARNNSQTNRVRLFPIEKLNKETAAEKWDRIKIICTQPFNKSLQYGISFVKLQSIEKIGGKKESSHSVGAFTLKDPESDEDKIKVGSFFKNFKTDLLATKAEGPKHETDDKSHKLIDKKEAYNAPAVGFYQPKKKELTTKRLLEEESVSNNDNKRSDAKKRKKEETSESKETSKKKINRNKEQVINPQASQPQKVNRKHRPFGQLMSDVVFVMSGYQNPQRANLRDKMIELGARYKSDWDKKCTHLLCAFRNTPKYRAIKGKGIIINEKWTEDCYQHKKRFSSTRYFLEKSQNPVDEEEEVWADEIMPKSSSDPSPKKEQVDEKSSDLSEYDADTEDEDTDEEIKRVLSKQTELKNSDDANKQEKTIFDEDTDIDEENQIQDTSHMELPPLADYFSNKVFFIYGTFNGDEEKLIKRYIIGFNGKLEEYMTEEVNYVITENEWDEHFEDALSDNANVQFVKPQWIWRCSEKKKFVPLQPYVIVPKEME